MKIFRQHNAATQHRGFTVVEMVVVIGITTALIAGVTFLFKSIFVDSRQESAASNEVDQSRLVAANFVNELRNATYGADASFALGEACNNEIIMFTPYKGNGTINRVRYFISGTNLEKGVTVPTGTPATYNPGANEKISIVLTGVQGAATTCGGSTPAFYYYDGSYIGSGADVALTQPINVNNVKFIRFNLTILKQDVTNGTSTFNVYDGAAIRSLKTNLGN